MKIEDAQIDWMEGLANSPKIEVLVDEIPELSGNEIWESYDDSLFLTEKEGYVWYFANPQTGGGLRYGDVQTEDGEKFSAYGCWSSRAGCINNADLSVQVVDVSITDNPSAMERGYTFHAGSITVDKAKEAMEFVDGAVIIAQEKFRNNETYYVPVKEE